MYNLNKNCEKAREKSGYQILWIDDQFGTESMKIYPMGFKDLGFKYFKSITEFEDFKIYYETKIQKKLVICIVPCELAD